MCEEGVCGGGGGGGGGGTFVTSKDGSCHHHRDVPLPTTDEVINTVNQGEP